MRAAAVTGLAAEARIARRAGLVAEASGGDAARTAALAEGLLAQGAAGLLSFGIAGGLDPALAPGSLLLPGAVRDGDGTVFPVDRAWRGRVLARLRELALFPAEDDLLGAAGVVALAAAKRELFHRTGAVAVDLESHVVARVAAAAGRPFLALRAVADPAARDLPPAAAIPLDAAGRARLGPVFASLARHPMQIPGLLRAALDAHTALAALERAAPALLG